MKRNANGEGNKIKYDSNRKCWYTQITKGFNPDTGKQERVTVRKKTKAEVMQECAKIKYEIANGTFIDKSEITVYELAMQILDDNLNLGYIQEQSYSRNIETLKRLKPIYNMPIQDVTITGVKAYLLTQQGYSQSVIDKVYTLLKKTLREAVDRGIILHNPMDKVTKPKSKQKKTKTRALTLEENKRLFDILVSEDVPYAPQMLLSMLTGMRMGEVNALQVKNINVPFKTISVEKTISRDLKGKAFINDCPKTEAGNRKIKVNDDVVEILKECIKGKNPDDMLFMKNGKLVTTSQVNNQFARLLEKYDIIDKSISGKVTTHSLRHTFATRCIESGMQAKVLQKILGHTDVSMTLNVYCDAFAEWEEQYNEQFNNKMTEWGLSFINRAKQPETSLIRA